jgi:thioredoxin-related protein
LTAAGAALLACALTASPPGSAQSGSSAPFAPDDTPTRDKAQRPQWFKASALDLRVDLRDAVDGGKRGLIVYFGQASCPYCIALMSVNFGTEADIVAYTRRHFDVVAIDAWGKRTVTDLYGSTLSESDYARREDTDFTPSLVFFDSDGREALRLRGYYAPYRFRAALAYVVEGYYRHESFRDYLQRADPPPKFDLQALNEQPFFAGPPYMFDRSRAAAQKPLLVFFEQRNCHACDILHGEPLNDPQTQALLRSVDSVQLDMRTDTPLTSPKGQRTTARDWATALQLYHAPVLVFFDERGEEIIRLDTVAQLYSLRSALEYVSQRGYLHAPTLQRWQEMGAAQQ